MSRFQASTRSLQARWVLAVLVFGLATSTASACPMCKDSVGNGGAEPTAMTASAAGPSSGGLPSGFNNSIYVMLASFVGVLGWVGFTLYRGGRQ